MPMTPGLVPNIRQPAPEASVEGEDADIVVEAADEAGDSPDVDEKGNILKIEHGDGSVTVSLDGKSLVESEADEAAEWFDNLVERIDKDELSRISGDLINGIDRDMLSRKEWVEDRTTGIKLLGLKIEVPSLQGGADGAPVEGMSKVRHPLLLEAVLRFQANARSELLPTDGPVKVRNDDNEATFESDQLSDALERDLNHYLTATATEYYPDTDRMLLMLGFGGTAFKKVYFCPLRNRPVSETVDADDLIVNNSATDLSNAKRITHRVYMRPSTVKRLQILGVYRDIDLSTPNAAKLDSLQREKKEVQGLSASDTNPEDRDREIYECYCELDVKGFEHKHKKRESGLEIPYRVTIDVSSREILSIVRNYNEDTEELPIARQNFVKYTFVPGMGFYDIGLLHILGNTTNAITAAWRELLDAGMYSNFPGFLMADTGGRQNTNIFRVPPGGGALVKTGGLPINQAIMPLPYQPPSQALMMLVNDISQTGMRIGGTSEQQVGEGRADAPVGTTLAMIEQATKVLDAVHKRVHAAQAAEFKLLVECFREHPESFWQRNNKPALQWDEAKFNQALDNCDLVPQADPNTASHGQRVMKIMALKQLQAANPGMYDPIAVDTAALQTIGWNNPQQFLIPPGAQKEMPPEIQKGMAEIQIKKQEADAKTTDSQARMVEAQAKVQAGLAGAATPEDPSKAMDLQIKALDAKTRAREIDIKHSDVAMQDESRDADRKSREKIQLLELARELLMNPEQAKNLSPEIQSLTGDMGEG